MDEFVSTFKNRLDGKGRVSVPATFRAVLGKDGMNEMFCCPALGFKAVDGGGLLYRTKHRKDLERFEPFSPEWERLSSVLLGSWEVIPVDKDGRAVLSDKLIAYAGLKDEVVFVGQGFKFQMWAPENFAAFKEEADALAMKMRPSGLRAPTGATG